MSPEVNTQSNNRPPIKAKGGKKAKQACLVEGLKPQGRQAGRQTFHHV
jgi:hypothetical protein